MSARSPFEYITNQILKKRCVPVAGAGVSLFSIQEKTLSNDKCNKVHQVPWMVDTLKKALIDLRFDKFKESEHGKICFYKPDESKGTKKSDGYAEPKQSGCIVELKKAGYEVSPLVEAPIGCFFCDVISASKAGKLGNLAELYIWELLSSGEKAPYSKLIELLQIPNYTTLTPTIAHRKIANLAREGLIGEVITTNYDCNFEKAFGSASGNTETQEYVIASLDEYRKKGAASYSESHSFNVYKINGCAAQLIDTSDAKKYENKCATILLTERQLQKWRNRQWAADIFKDRLRSNTLFFNGFGSDEPQIHHTLQTVLDEYSDDGGLSDECSDNKPRILDTHIHTAPIVAIYDPHPSFHQQQIVRSYALQQTGSIKDSDKLILKNPKAGGTLTADALWEAIFQRVYRQLLINALKHSKAPENASFTGIVPCSASILGEILSSFEKTLKADDEQSLETTIPDWLNSYIKDENINMAYQLLSEYLKALKVNFNEGYYEPINSNKALMSELMLLLYILFEPKVTTDFKITTCEKKGLGITFNPRSKANNSKAKTFYVSSNPSSLNRSSNVISSKQASEFCLIIGNAGGNISPSIQRVSNSSENKSIKPRHVISLGWRHIFKDDKSRLNISSVKSKIKDAVKYPTSYFYANQSSLNKRDYLKEL